eukprot:TRINITY_DN14996_c0_g1_i1.p1 TRINITY_DN14996_c0_g1~~TRINITY_DN14996_c0_g1_i1.p1  ORF type:complete len:263 (-),score=44.63 TRINITY_DN14996_c0_g1_i1:42-755(-)
MKSLALTTSLFVTLIVYCAAQQCCLSVYEWSASYTADVFVPSGDSYDVQGSYFYSEQFFKVGQRFSVQVLDGPNQGRSRNGKQILDFIANKYFMIDEATGHCRSGPINQKLPSMCYGTQWGWKPTKTITVGLSYKVGLFANTTVIRGYTTNSTEAVALYDGCAPLENLSTFRSIQRNMTSHTIIYNIQNGITDPTIFSVPDSCRPMVSFDKENEFDINKYTLHQLPFIGPILQSLYF